MSITHPSCRFHRQSGVTLVESAAVLGIVAVLVGVAAPTFDEVRATRALEAAAAQLRTDVHHARSTAVALGQTVRLQVPSGGAGSCYLVHTGNAGDCSCTAAGTATCVAPARALRTVSFATGDRLKVSANASSLAFDAFQGTVTPTGSLTVTNGRGDQLRVVVNVMGRARTCLANGPLHGHPAC